MNSTPARRLVLEIPNVITIACHAGWRECKGREMESLRNRIRRQIKLNVKADAHPGTGIYPLVQCVGF